MKKIIFMLTTLFLLSACTNGKKAENTQSVTVEDTPDSSFQYSVDKFADVEILRYYVPGFKSLSLKQKELIYYLNQAALEGRDILWDQNNRYNLSIRRLCETLYQNFAGDKTSEDWKNFEMYLKQIWMAKRFCIYDKIDRRNASAFRR